MSFASDIVAHCFPLNRNQPVGAIDGADPALVSDHAKQRGLAQGGTLGSGFHFLDVQYVEHVFDPGCAEAQARSYVHRRGNG